MSNGRRFNGWRHDLEPRQRLHVTAVPFLLAVPFAEPVIADYRDWLAIEGQGQMGSCVGHMMTSCLEVCNWFDTRGQVVQLSEMFSYLMAQKVDGLSGDVGATIFGGVEAAKRYGACLEATFPYPESYTNKVPKKALDEAAGHRLLKHVVLKNYADVYGWLASGVGTVAVGIMIRESWMDAGAVIDSQKGSVIGGHAIAMVSLSERKDTQGRNYVWHPGSWGKEWGDNGWAEINPKLFDAWGADKNTEMIGVTDLEEFAPRKIDWGKVRVA